MQTWRCVLGRFRPGARGEIRKTRPADHRQQHSREFPYRSRTGRPTHIEYRSCLPCEAVVELDGRLPRRWPIRFGTVAKERLGRIMGCYRRKIWTRLQERSGYSLACVMFVVRMLQPGSNLHLSSGTSSGANTRSILASLALMLFIGSHRRILSVKLCFSDRVGRNNLLTIAV